MELERAIPNHNGARIANLARDKEDEHANPQTFVYFFVMFSSAILFLLPFEIEREKTKQKFLSKAHHGGFFVIMAIISPSVAVLASVILVFASFFLRRWMKNIHYTILKSTGCFSAILAPFSLVIVLYVPRNLHWVVYSVIYVICVVLILVAYYFAWKYGCCYQQDERFNEYLFHWTVFLVIIVPILYALSPFLAPWVQLPFICVGILVLVVVAVKACIGNHQSEEKQSTQLGSSSRSIMFDLM